jgi:hypothetical protein
MKISRLVMPVLFCFACNYAIAQEQNIPAYGRTILTVSPVQVSERTPTGFGIQYERILTNKVSLSLPIAYSFGNSDPCDPSIKSRVFYAYPGVKFYPAGYRHKVTYAVGPSLAFGQGTSNCDCIDPATQTNEPSPKKYHPLTEMGVMVNNSINVQATSKVYLGAEIGMGASYLNIENGKNMGSDLMLQMNFKVGYRLP